MTSFSIKQLRVTFILAGSNQVFPGTNSNTLVLTNLRVSATAEAVSRQTTSLDLRVYGMTAQDMNALTVVWANPPVVLDHIVIVEANDGNGWTQVFKGTIVEAQPEYRRLPNVYFHVLARTGYFGQIQAADHTTYTGATPITQIVSDLAKRMGFTFADGGATGVLQSPYLDGTLYDQLFSACGAAHADFYFLGDTLLITDSGKPRQQQPAVVLNPQSGLIGYPVYDRAGLNVLSIFNPAFLCGTPINLTSSVPNATGRWYPYATSHVLESLTMRGRWDSQLKCLRVLV